MKVALSFQLLAVAFVLGVCQTLETNSRLHTLRLLHMEGELLDLSRDVLTKDEHFSEDDDFEDVHDFAQVDR